MTAFLSAARAGDSEGVERALSDGVDVNQGSAYDWTALMFASCKGQEDVVVRLLDAGAHPNRLSKRITRNTQGLVGQTNALALATQNRHNSIARITMACGAEVDSMSLALAADLEDDSLLKEMVAQEGTDGALDLSAPLVNACKAGQLENPRWLVAQGAEGEG